MRPGQRSFSDQVREALRMLTMTKHPTFPGLLQRKIDAVLRAEKMAHYAPMTFVFCSKPSTSQRELSSLYPPGGAGPGSSRLGGRIDPHAGSGERSGFALKGDLAPQ